MEFSKRTRLKFGDFASSHGVIREIDRVFQSEDFEHAEPWDRFDSGQRRSLVSAYHENIDFSDSAQLARLACVYTDALASWGRDAEGALTPGARDLIRSLQRDGVPIKDEGELTGAVSLNLLLTDLPRLGEPRVVEQHLERIALNVERDPAAAVGSAKELVESVCKLVLDDHSVAYEPSESLLELYKKTATALKLNREAVPESAKGSAAAQRVLQNLATAVQSLAELRNELGLGHGKTKPSPAFARHARLAFNASRTVTEFLLETWHVRREEPKSGSDI